jgi:hypothetical protein
MTVKLRRGIYWSDGVEFTTDDVIYTIQTHLNANRDRGTSHDATPPTPPGIRVRTTAASVSIENSPRPLKRLLVKARCSAPEELSRHGPFGLKMAALAAFSVTFRRRSSR